MGALLSEKFSQTWHPHKACLLVAFICMQDKLFGGSISRDQVADVVVEALYTPAASFKTVEIIAEETATPKPIQDLFATV